MKDLIAYCGLDCETCDARIATMNDDQTLREKTAKLWSEMNHTTITADMIHCAGCHVPGVKFHYCGELCPIRKCAMAKGVETCGGCAGMDGCESLAAIIANAPAARENLKNAT